MILGLLLAAGGLALLYFMPGGYDYIVSAPAFSAEATVEETLERLDRVMELPWAASLKLQHAEITAGPGKEGVTATLYAVSEGYFDFAHETLAEGRLLNGEDQRARAARALVNRKGAESLFNGRDAVGETLQIGDLRLEVAGVLAGGWRPGEADEVLIYVPITLADAGKPVFQALEIKTGARGSEEKAMAAAALKNWNAGGTVQDAERTRAAALMPLWLIGMAAGLHLLIRGAGGIRSLGRSARAQVRNDLESQYASRVAPKAVLRFLPVAGAAVLWAAFAWGVLWLLVQPLYIFTDWIPESPLDPQSVWLCAVNLMKNAAAAAVFRNRGAGIADAAAGLIRAGCLVFLAGAVTWGRAKKRQ